MLPPRWRCALIGVSRCLLLLERRWCPRLRSPCISCATCWRTAGRPGSSSSARATRTCTRWCRGSCCCSALRRRVPVGARARDGRPQVAAALQLLVAGAVADVLGVPAGDLRVPGVPRGCSQPGTRRGWPASSATAAGGRCRRRCASGWCSPPCFTGRAGCCTKLRAARRGAPSRGRRRAAAVARHRRPSPLVLRRWRWDGRAAVLLAELAASPARASSRRRVLQLSFR